MTYTTFISKLVLISFMVYHSISAANNNTLNLASYKNTQFRIITFKFSSPTEKFANQELKKYLELISGAEFQYSEIVTDYSIIAGTSGSLKKMNPSLILPVLQQGEYGIFRRGNSIFLAGVNDIAVIHAVYHFLSELGCVWIAPDFDFYEGTCMYVPQKTELVFNETDDIIRAPELKYRKLYIEEGLTHNVENLKKLIDWMPKARFNVLVAPLNYEGKGRVQWDNWSKQLSPELEKRGITIEVGGHGYQNFLNAFMEDGQLYKNHREWFGLDKNGERSSNPHVVFCTSNIEAVNYLHKNLLAYLNVHPEIDIFDFWPPDSETWCMCDKCKALGSETERHALLVSQTARLLQNEVPEVKLECLAYSRYLEPPKHEVLDQNILLDFCPINQSFEYQIYNDSAENNKSYKKALLSWLKIFDGDISIYSYYRKYAWRSLPVIIPHYMQYDLKFYRDCGADGISVYSEPGDWFTYGLNQYVLAQLAWNPDIDVDSLIVNYCSKLYGPSAELAIEIYNELESIVRFGCKIPFTDQKDSIQYNQYISRLEICSKRIEKAMIRMATEEISWDHLNRLKLMVKYATESATFMKYNSEGKTFDADKITDNIKQLINENTSTGVFIAR